MRKPPSRAGGLGEVGPCRSFEPGGRRASTTVRDSSGASEGWPLRILLLVRFRPMVVGRTLIYIVPFTIDIFEPSQYLPLPRTGGRRFKYQLDITPRIMLRNCQTLA